MQKAVFTWKMGPIPQYGDGEVELRENGLAVKLPLQLANRLKLGDTIKATLKSSLYAGIVGPAGLSLGRGEEVVIPYPLILSAGIKEQTYGVFGKRKFIHLVIGGEKGSIELVFAPFEGYFSRKFRTEEFYQQLMTRIQYQTAQQYTYTQPTYTQPQHPSHIPQQPATTTQVPQSEKFFPNYCPKCGYKVEQYMNFCPRCGFKLLS